LFRFRFFSKGHVNADATTAARSCRTLNIILKKNMEMVGTADTNTEPGIYGDLEVSLKKVRGASFLDFMEILDWVYSAISVARAKCTL